MDHLKNSLPGGDMIRARANCNERAMKCAQRSTYLSDPVITLREVE